MSKEPSIAPKERVNIVYRSQTSGAQEETELPLKILMVGDYTGRPEEKPVEELRPINVNKENLAEVMAKQGLRVEAEVADRLSGRSDATLSVNLTFQKLDDFAPEGIVNQVPELKRLLELRGALTSLKHPLGNIPAFRKKIQALLGDEAAREKLMKELGLE